MVYKEEHFTGKKIAIVANRAPTTLVKRSSTTVLERSVGGLAAALEPLIEKFNGMWFCTTSKSEETPNELLEKIPYKVCCLELTDTEISSYYEGYSNKQLWPICHYFPSMCMFNDGDWATYKSVNEKMAKLILENVDENYFIWVNDYHFFLLPSLLRAKNPKLKIGFFLHVPFPNQEVFRLLANRNELINGLLGADLIGFHTSQYVEHFINCVSVLLSHIDKEPNKETLIVNGRKVFVKNFPISVDFKYITQTAASEEVIKKADDLRKAYQSELIGISVDRLDYTKGPVERLLAIEHFFDTYPKYLKKISFIQISVPSRTNIETYQVLKKKVDETIGRINGKFSKEGWSPIHYIYGTLPFVDLVTHYILSDIALVVPLRDGMNLVAKEYVASNLNQKGVLILSEFAGAQEELNSALHVNPYHKSLVAKAINDAIEMPLEEKTSRMCNLREKVKSNDVYNWVNNYFKSFNEAVETNKKVTKVH